MRRRDREPIDVAWFETREQAEAAWSDLIEAGVPCAILSDATPWGKGTHRIQCARCDAGAAMALLAEGRRRNE